jgi:hypothetical protein
LVVAAILNAPQASLRRDDEIPTKRTRKTMVEVKRAARIGIRSGILPETSSVGRATRR